MLSLLFNRVSVVLVVVLITVVSVNAKPLTAKSILSMKDMGLNDALIVKAIKTNGLTADWTSAERRQIKRAQLSRPILEAILGARRVERSSSRTAFRRPTDESGWKTTEGHRALTDKKEACGGRGSKIIAVIGDPGGSLTCGVYEFVVCGRADGRVIEYYMNDTWIGDEERCGPIMSRRRILGERCKRPFPDLSDLQGFGPEAYENMWARLGRYLAKSCQ